MPVITEWKRIAATQAMLLALRSVLVN